MSSARPIQLLCRQLLPALCLFLLQNASEAATEEATLASSSYTARGTVRSIAADRSSITIAHEEIPGLMPAMTMAFPLADKKLAEQLSPGDRVEFVLRTGNEWRIERLRLLEAGSPPSTAPHQQAGPPPVPQPESSPTDYYQVPLGEPVPEFRLTNHEGQPLSLSELRGKLVIMSFLYTNCPMPQYCPLLARKLAQLQQKLGPRLGTEVHLLVVTIDPHHDTPDILRRYAREKGLSLRGTDLLTGPERDVALVCSYFGLEYYPEEDGSLAHKMRLVLLDPEGRLQLKLLGNSWTVEEVLEAIEKLLATDQETSSPTDNAPAGGR